MEQIIFSGLEIGWDKLIINIKKENPNIVIKVICNTIDSLLYYEYERNNFFNLLRLSKQNQINNIAFFRIAQYETYSMLGYNCSYIMENYTLANLEGQAIKEKTDNINLGIYPLNYTWDKNIFNQLCIAKFIDNCNLNYNKLNERMEDFLKTMKIANTPKKIETLNEANIVKELVKNDVIVSTSFTEYMHPIFWLSMEIGIPCLIGNNSDFFEDDEELKRYVVTSAEDNPIINSKKVVTILENKERINELYKSWKASYDIKAQQTINAFLEK